MTWLRESRSGQMVVALLAGGVAFAAIWLAGYPEVAYLGFVAASIIWGGTTRGHSRASCLRWRRLGLTQHAREV
jgi:hypothetical protein